MDFRPIYYKERLEKKVINPEGTVGVVTLWSKWRDLAQRIQISFPDLFYKDSPIVLFSNFYGNGLPQMLANLAHNPQISRIAVLGNDAPLSPSYSFLTNFLREGVEIETFGGIEMGKIKGTTFYLDKQLKPEYFSHIEVQRFSLQEKQRFYEFVRGNTRPVQKERLEILLEEPRFSDFPSDITRNVITSETPLSAWIELLTRMGRYGKTIKVRKGPSFEERRVLLDVNVSVKNPSFEKEEKLAQWGFGSKELRAYQEQMLSSVVPEGLEYSYGNRLREYWGGDTLEKLGEMLSVNPQQTFAFTSVWDPRNDLFQRKSTPCLTDVQFIRNPVTGKLSLMAGFRSQDLASAWVPNMYGLAAIQEYVALKAGMSPGEINLRTRYLELDINALSSRALVAKASSLKRESPILDPKGNYLVEARPHEGKIAILHYHPDGTFLETIEGESISELKEKLRRISRKELREFISRM